MPLHEAMKTKMLEDTRAAAANFVEDIEFFRSLFSKPSPSRFEIRQLSNHLRKLLLDGQIKEVSSPRIGRVQFLIPDNRPVFEGLRTHELVMVGFPAMFGMDQVLDFYTVRSIANMHIDNPEFHLAGDNKLERVVNLQVFLSDVVIRWGRTEIDRREILQYICYHDFGVHPKGQREAKTEAIEALKNVISVGRNGHQFEICVGEVGGKPTNEVLLDYAHAILFSIAVQILRSPDVMRLEALIREEIGKPMR